VDRPKLRLPIGQSDFRALRQHGHGVARPRGERGASPVIELAAAFDGKRAWVARADE